MKTVYLYGKLGKRFGKKWNLSVGSTSEAFAAIEANSEGFLSYLINSQKKGVDYCVLNKNPLSLKTKRDFESAQILPEQVTVHQSSKEIHILAAPQGGVVFVPAMFVGGVVSGGLTLFGKIVVALAVSFVVGAIMNALFKPPKRGEPTTTKSFLMRGSANRTSQGVAVPLGYGTLKIGSTNISKDRIVRRLKQKNNNNSNKILESYSSIEYLELLCEGPIEGLVSQNGESLFSDGDLREAIYLNNVPIKNPPSSVNSSGERDGSLNYVLNEEGDLPEAQLGEEDSGKILCSQTGMGIDYGSLIFGAGPYVDNPDKASHRTSFSSAVRNNAKIITHCVINPDVTRTRLSLASKLTYQDDKGNTHHQEVRFAIHVLRDNKEYNVLDSKSGCTVTKNETSMNQAIPPESSDGFGLMRIGSGAFVVRGLCSDDYSFDVVIDFKKPKASSKGVTFKIVKLTNELDPSTKGGNLGGLSTRRELRIGAATDYVVEDLLYPHSAVAKIRFDSKNFSDVPNRSYLCKMKRVLVPSNYNPHTRKCDGPWNGLFRGQIDSTMSVHSIPDSEKVWTDNPAWVYYDLLSNARFGLSKFGMSEENIDKWQLYKISKYCDELVETGYPIETQDGVPRSFTTDNKVDGDGNISLVLTNSQYVPLDRGNPTSVNWTLSSDGIGSSLFEEEFGKDISFRGKKMAIFIDANSSGNLDVKIERATFRKEEVILEERAIVHSDPSTKTIVISGGPLEAEFNSQVVGSCAAQINHSVVEPRFTANAYVTDKMNALNLVNNFASVFRGITTYYNGKITATQDSFKNPLALFTNSNVSVDGFSYSGISKDQKITTSLVRYNNKDNGFKADLVAEEDPEAAQKFGYKEEETMGFGISSEAQARRLAKWMLFTTQVEVETVNFKTGIEGGYLFPGAVFEVSDESRTGSMKSGRILDIGSKLTYNNVERIKPWLLLDKNLIKEPFKNTPEITVCVGMSDSDVDKVEARAPFERSSEDQDAEISSVFAPQILRFRCVLEVDSRVFVQGPQGQAIVATGLELKVPFELDIKENRFEIFNHDFEDGDIIEFETEGLLPAGLERKVKYTISDTTKHTFKIKNVSTQQNPTVAEVEIGNPGEDRLGNQGGHHFIIADQQKTLDAVNKISIGSTWSMRGRVAGRGSVPFAPSETIKQSLGIEGELGLGNWVNSSFLGPIMMHESDYCYSPSMGWIYINKTQTDQTWIWIKNIGEWVFVPKKSDLPGNPSIRRWWYINNLSQWLYIFYEDGSPTTGFLYSDNPVNSGENLVIGEYSTIATSKGVSPSGNKFVFAPGMVESQEPVPDSPAQPNFVQEMSEQENFVQVDVILIESVSADRSAQKKKCIRITLNDTREKNLRVSDGQLVALTQTSSQGFIGIDRPDLSGNNYWKLLKINDFEFELLNSSSAADLVGNNTYTSGKISFLSNDIESFSGNMDSKLYKTMSTKENGDGTFEVTGLEYVSAKFGAIDKMDKVLRPRVPIPPQASMDIPEAPTDLILTDLTV